MLCCGAPRPTLESKYEVHEPLGVGNFAVVKLCTQRDTGDKFAVKIVLKEGIDAEARADVLREVAILRHLDHPNVIKLRDLFENRVQISLVVELASGGELFDRIAERGFYTEASAAELIKQLAEGLIYMHSFGVTHRDIKPENILFASKEPNSPVKITDFGLAYLQVGDESTPMHGAVGSPTYVAPEVLRNEGYGQQVDIWSLGVVLYILLCGYPPFSHEDMRTQLRLIKEAEVEFPPKQWDAVSEDARSVVLSMLVKDPKQRTTLQALCAHPWVCGSCAPTINLSETLVALKNFTSNRRLRKAGRAVLATVRITRKLGLVGAVTSSLRLSRLSRSPTVQGRNIFRSPSSTAPMTPTEKEKLSPGPPVRQLSSRSSRSSMGLPAIVFD
ncbi:kinase-like domain-containing protein [Pavlovales sp. CCMP2436]|nr:kinase-like domain-containing protein [Pavlovales sp. CCMP2436]